MDSNHSGPRQLHQGYPCRSRATQDGCFQKTIGEFGLVSNYSDCCQLHHNYSVIQLEDCYDIQGGSEPLGSVSIHRDHLDHHRLKLLQHSSWFPITRGSHRSLGISPELSRVILDLLGSWTVHQCFEDFEDYYDGITRLASKIVGKLKISNTECFATSSSTKKARSALRQSTQS